MRMNKPTPSADPRIVGSAMAYASTLCAIDIRRPQPVRR